MHRKACRSARQDFEVLREGTSSLPDPPPQRDAKRDYRRPRAESEQHTDANAACLRLRPDFRLTQFNRRSVEAHTHDARVFESAHGQFLMVSYEQESCVRLEGPNIQCDTASQQVASAYYVKPSDGMILMPDRLRKAWRGALTAPNGRLLSTVAT